MAMRVCRLRFWTFVNYFISAFDTYDSLVEENFGRKIRT